MEKDRVRITVILIALAGGMNMHQSARCAVVSIVSAHDNTLYQNAAGSLSNGSGQFMFAGNSGNNIIRRGLFMFDIAGAIPAGSTIDSASLTLHMSMTGAGATDVGLHRVLAAWGEGASAAAGGEGGGAPAAPGDATWLHTFFNTSFWTNPGGDFDPAISAVTSVDAIGFYTWNSPQMNTDVQKWLDSPAMNFGWLVRGDESGPSTSKRFDTRENISASFRPMLTIDYTPVPGPGALGIVFMWLVAPHSRRRNN